MTERFIRRYQSEDRPALTRICVETGDDGRDARGLFRKDALLGDVYAVPYALFDPSLAFVVDDGGVAVGYILATADSTAFYAWFRDVWWPSVRDEYAGDEVAPRDGRLLAYAAALGATPSAFAEDFPAHLHIDLLPAAQGGGFGRALVTTVLDALRERGVRGVHLVASATNTNAVGFYERLGFMSLPAGDGEAAFGMRL